jgi:hypothetical protein
MPGLGPMGRGGARRRTRRRMMAVGSMANQRGEAEQQPEEEPPEREEDFTEDTGKLEKLAKLLKDKGVITESEYDLLFG